MRIKMKRFLGILLGISLALGVMPGMSTTALAETYSGYITDDNGAVFKVNAVQTVAPEISVWSPDSVYVTAVSGQEYVIVKTGEEPDWSKAVTSAEEVVGFEGLTPATEYTVYTRVKETESTLASDAMGTEVLTLLNGWETRGEAKTGETITIIPDPENTENLTWQWYYAEEIEEGYIVKDEAIEGAVSSSYTIKETDVGKYLYHVIYKGGKELADGYVGPVRITIDPAVTLDGWAYGEDPNTPIVTGNTGDGDVSFAYVEKGTEDPESETVPTLPGTYTVYAYIEESGDYAYGYAETDFTITKGTPAITAPKAKSLGYTGSSQELVEAGFATGGEIQYALGSDATAAPADSIYTTSIPTATNAGTYYVWYKAVGDSNHFDSDAACVTVTIDENTYTYTYAEKEQETPSEDDGAETPAPVTDWLEPLRVKLHIAGELGGEQLVEHDGDFALPYEFMVYLKEHPGITLVYHITFEGEEFTVTIPGKYVVADPETGWYGPIWLRGHFVEGAYPKTVKTNQINGTYIVKKDDTLTIIAKMFGTSVNALVEKNGIKNKDLIYPGQSIKY